MLRIAALNEEFSEESSGIDEPSVPTKEVDVSKKIHLFTFFQQYCAFHIVAVYVLKKCGY